MFAATRVWSRFAATVVPAARIVTPDPALNWFASNPIPCVERSPDATVQVNSSFVTFVRPGVASKLICFVVLGSSRSVSTGLPTTSTAASNVTRARTRSSFLYVSLCPAAGVDTSATLDTATSSFTIVPTALAVPMVTPAGRVDPVMVTLKVSFSSVVVSPVVDTERVASVWPAVIVRLAPLTAV